MEPAQPPPATASAKTPKRTTAYSPGNMRLAFEGAAPLHAARTSQRDVPTTLNTYPVRRKRVKARVVVFSNTDPRALVFAQNLNRRTASKTPSHRSPSH